MFPMFVRRSFFLFAASPSTGGGGRRLLGAVSVLAEAEAVAVAVAVRSQPRRFVLKQTSCDNSPVQTLGTTMGALRGLKWEQSQITWGPLSGGLHSPG